MLETFTMTELMNMRFDKVNIDLSNGFKLVAEKNSDPAYANEIFVGITDGNGVWWQDLAVIRQAYKYDSDGSVKWSDEEFEVMVYTDKDNEDYTHKFSIGLFHCGI